MRRGPARTLAKVEANLTESLRQVAGRCRTPRLVEPIEVVLGRRLQVVRLTVSLPQSGQVRRASGKFPLVVEPRTRGQATDKGPLVRVYHPLRPREWFTPPEGMSLEDAAAVVLPTALDVPGRGGDRGAQGPRPRSAAAGGDVGADQGSEPQARQEEGKALAGCSARIAARDAAAAPPCCASSRSTRPGGRSTGGSTPGMPRKTLRERLGQLMCGRRRVSVLLVGPSGSGKSTVVRPARARPARERRLPQPTATTTRSSRCFRLAGRRIIAGMSYLGQWEQRCVDLVSAGA